MCAVSDLISSCINTKQSFMLPNWRRSAAPIWAPQCINKYPILYQRRMEIWKLLIRSRSPSPSHCLPRPAVAGDSAKRGCGSPRDNAMLLLSPPPNAPSRHTFSDMPLTTRACGSLWENYSVQVNSSRDKVMANSGHASWQAFTASWGSVIPLLCVLKTHLRWEELSCVFLAWLKPPSISWQFS